MRFDDKAVEWLDAHNHLHFSELDVFGDELWGSLDAAGVAGGMICGTHPGDWLAAVERARGAATGCWLVSAGVHPWKAGQLREGWMEELEELLSSGEVQGVGEIGLDRWIEGVDFRAQGEVFSKQWRMAARLGLPVTVHCLRAWEDLWAVLEELPPVSGFLLHAYGGSAVEVKRWVKKGAWFSFSGSFLGRPRKVQPFFGVPLERLLIETDAPAMLPARGFQFWPEGMSAESFEREPPNHPASLAACGRALAEELRLPEAELAAMTRRNFETLFGPVS